MFSLYDSLAAPFTPRGTRATLRRVGAASILLLLCTMGIVIARSAWPQGPCCYDGPLSPSAQNCNVVWSASDSLTACPAGDSVSNVRPSRLYIRVHYQDNNCEPRVGVPPESVWVTYTTLAGNLRVNDQGPKIFADDSTNADGDTRVTLRSFSGCGTARCNLFVSGKASGYVDRLVRTTDTDADGRVGVAETISPCDLNYDGKIDLQDKHLAEAHVDHWHRNALFGTLVRRTNYCETCPDFAANTKGESQLFWSPSGRFIAHTFFADQAPADPGCVVAIVPSDPKDGNSLTRFTFPPPKYHDYDPSWSPLNDVIAWDRADSVILKKQVPWSGNPAEVVVTASNNPGCGSEHGDDIPAISPDGQWVVFSRCNGDPTGGWSLWKIPITGGAAVQLTGTAVRADFYASWSPDGQTIYFQRKDDAVGPGQTLWKVPAAGGVAQPVFIPPPTPVSHAAQPALSPDGKILLMGYGDEDPLARRVITHTLDPILPSPSPAKVIPNYPDTNFADSGLFPDFPILSPRLSPDGTRTALGSKQIYAARRNMNLPPRIAQVGTQGVADTTAKTPPINAANGLPTSVQVLSTDPEGDPITCRAYFLRSGMTFDTTTCTLHWTPSEIIGTTVYVKFLVTTQSGGSDQIIAELHVVAPPQPGSAVRAGALEGTEPDGPNPTHGRFAITAPVVPGSTATLEVLDISGRRMAIVRGLSGSQLVWDGRDRTGRLAAPGIYLYRMEVGNYRKEGSVVVLR